MTSFVTAIKLWGGGGELDRPAMKRSNKLDVTSRPHTQIDNVPLLSQCYALQSSSVQIFATDSSFLFGLVNAKHTKILTIRAKIEADKAVSETMPVRGKSTPETHKPSRHPRIEHFINLEKETSQATIQPWLYWSTRAHSKLILLVPWDTKKLTIVLVGTGQWKRNDNKKARRPCSRDRNVRVPVPSNNHLSQYPVTWYCAPKLVAQAPKKPAISDPVGMT
ncbi:hypothetical protein ACRALDRAFT_1091205 [Sodiomyces alcalophilus JCM 7366]|uniref:uncharacterized protein n=1 Tax=Sodiomyces alcalophilus JCM 7366 TaxID=591952 RepID=UPI0039B5C1F9